MQVEPSADVIVSARPSILVGGGAKKFAGVAAKKCFFKDSRKISFYPKNFLITFFSHRKL